MKNLILMFFMLVQVGSMTYVNPDFIVSVHSEFGQRTTIDMATPATVTVYSDWSIDKVLEVLKKYFDR